MEEQRKGGQNSGKARREKKAMRERLQILLTLPVEKGKLKDIEKIKDFGELQKANITVEDAMIVAVMLKALGGDIPAATFIRDTLGEKPSKDDWDGLGEDDI